MTDAALGFLFSCIFPDLKCPLLSNNSLTVKQLFQNLISLHNKVKGRVPSALLQLLSNHHNMKSGLAEKAKLRDL